MQAFHCLLSVFILCFLVNSAQAADDAFAQGWAAYNEGNFGLAEERFAESLKKSSAMDDYKVFFLARSQQEQRKFKEASGNFNKVLTKKPNHRLQMEVYFSLGQIELGFGNLKKARAYLSKPERRYRGTDLYPKVLWELAEVERAANRRPAMCGHLLKLYTKFPNFEKVAAWGPDLDKDNFAGRQTSCKFEFDDFKTRLRYLVWAGQHEKAKSELEVVRERIKKDDAVMADVLSAQFHVMENEPEMALELVKPHLKNRKSDVDFLSNYAMIAARALDFQTSIASYLRINKLTPNSSTGISALGQAAYLSYIGQDYDGAYRKYQELAEKFPKSRQGQDADWFIGWIRYLRGDYDGSTQAFYDLLSDQNRKKGRTGVRDRTAYWLAMSYFRRGHLHDAKAIFQLLAKDPTLGYYSIAAKARLNKLPILPLKVQSKAVSPTPPSLIGSFSSPYYLMIEESTSPEMSELDLLQIQLAGIDRSTDSEDAIGPISDSGEVETLDSIAEFQEGLNIKPDYQLRLERAKLLAEQGLFDWAKWDLYEVEKKTRDKEILKGLMALYQQMKSYNRSSYIAQIHFTSPRVQQPLEVSRLYWELAYPKAYEAEVTKYTEQFGVPRDLVWGIMRAESQFKPEAISSVGAMGLMQVMPMTGLKVAEVMEDKKFQPEDLLQPPTSVRYGSRYLKRLLERFDNLYPLVAAGYNAGPHRVSNWLGLFGRLETDEFIDHIPFTETRNYVKKVISNTYIYRTLYDKSGDKISYLADPLPYSPENRSPSGNNWEDI